MDQQQALNLLIQIANEMKTEDDKPAAALIQAQAADILWKFDENQARTLFRLALETVKQPIREVSVIDKEAVAKRADLVRRQASVMKSIVGLFAKHDRPAAEHWLESLTSELNEAKNQSQTSSERSEFLAQLALEEAKTNPNEAQTLGLMALAGTEIPQAFGELLFALSSIDRTKSDVLFQAAIAALRRNGFPTGSTLSVLSNYLFASSGMLFARDDLPNARLFISYLVDTATNEVNNTRAIGKGEPIPPSALALVNFLGARGLAIAATNAPDKSRLLQPLFNELVQGLNQAQLNDLTLLSTNVREQRAMETADGADWNKQIDLAEHEKDQVVRDYMWRMIAIGMMRGDPENALAIAKKIDDDSMRAQTQDDIRLVLVADRIRSVTFSEAREAALEFNDLNLRAKSLAQIADRAWSSDRELATNFLGEAYELTSKAQPTPDRVAITLILIEKFAKFDVQRGFELLPAVIKTLNQVPEESESARPPVRRGIRVVSYTMVGGAELTTGEHATLNSLTFDGLKGLAQADYYRSRNLGDEIQNKVIRGRYIIAITRAVLDGADRPVKATRSSTRPAAP
jgi:hypothetical protein